MGKGLFITFEGTEGSGKSTLIRTLDLRFRKMKLKTVLTREPGGPPLSEKIRQLILENPMDPWTELFLYEASRAEHIVKVIKPAIKAGKITLCDRFADSSLAYQAYARGLPWKTVRQLNMTATRGLKPDLTVLLDVRPKLGLKRATDRNRFEEEGVKFQEKVRKGFLKAMSADKSRWLRLEVGSATPDELADKVMDNLNRRFFRRRK